MTMPTISLVEDLRPYRDRAAELTAAIVACEPGALDDGRAFSDELDERFVDPLTAEYEQIPLEVRAHDRRHGIQHVDAISELITTFAGAWELSTLHDIARGTSGDGVTVRTLEMDAAALRYREKFGPALSGTATP